MSEWKDYQCIDMVFPFIAGYIYRITGHRKELKMTKVNTLYSKLVVDQFSDKSLSGVNDERIAWLAKITRVPEEDCTFIQGSRQFRAVHNVNDEDFSLDHRFEHLAQRFKISHPWMQPLMNTSVSNLNRPIYISSMKRATKTKETSEAMGPALKR